MFMRVPATVPHITMDSLEKLVNAENLFSLVFLGF